MERTERDYLSVDEVAERLDLNPATIYQWVRAGRLPAWKAGRGWRIDRAIFAAWIEERKAGR
jgi:excisionase family DNA binding protein